MRESSLCVAPAISGWGLRKDGTRAGRSHLRRAYSVNPPEPTGSSVGSFAKHSTERVASKKNNGHGVQKRAANDRQNEKPDCFLSIHADGVKGDS
jgi:hypothetical protein